MVLCHWKLKMTRVRSEARKILRKCLHTWLVVALLNGARNTHKQASLRRLARPANNCLVLYDPFG